VRTSLHHEIVGVPRQLRGQKNLALYWQPDSP
jgi:hypothetical protein